MKGGGGLVGFLVAVVLGRDLGTAGSGRFFLALAIVTILASAVRLGFDQVATRFVAEFDENRDDASVNRLYAQAMGWAVSVGSALGLVCAWASRWIAAEVFEDAAFGEVLGPMALSLPAVAVVWLHAHFFQGIGDVKLFQAFRGLAVLVVFLILVGICLAAIPSTVAGVTPAYGWLYLVASWVVAALAHTLWRRNFAGFRWDRNGWRPGGPWTSALPAFLAINAATQISQWCPQIILGMFADADQVGVFTAAFRVATLGSLILFGVNSVVFPKFAVLYGRGDIDGLRAVVRSSTLITAVAALPFFAILVVLPGPILNCFGAEFTAGASILQIAAVGQLVNVATGSVGGLLNMSGNERVVLRGILLGLVIAVGVNLALIPIAGAVGAAVAGSAATSGTMLYLTVVCRRRLGFSPVSVVATELRSFITFGRRQ